MLQLGIGGVGGKSTYLVNVMRKNGKIIIGDVSSTASGAVAGSFNCSLDFGVVYRIRFEITLAEDPDEFSVYLYVDNELVTYGSASDECSTNYARAADGDTPRTDINGDKVTVRPNGNADFSAYFDDFYLEFE